MMTPSAWHALAHLVLRGPAPASRLALYLDIRSLRNLAQEGYVARDGNFYRITRRGLSLVTYWRRQ